MFLSGMRFRVLGSFASFWMTETRALRFVLDDKSANAPLDDRHGVPCFSPRPSVFPAFFPFTFKITFGIVRKESLKSHYCHSNFSGGFSFVAGGFSACRRVVMSVIICRYSRFRLFARACARRAACPCASLPPRKAPTCPSNSTPLPVCF